MKRTILSVLILLVCLAGSAQNRNICRLGIKYDISKNQEALIEYIGADPRNETTFVINDMKASMEPLDKTLMKKKKESRSKFARQQKEKEYGIKR